jgi:diacylglycerol kinase family enzyme
LLGSYRKNKATITVDGKTTTYDQVWFASTMKGRFYGGGMMVAPQQDRFNKKGTVSVVCLHKWSRLVTLMRFTSLFKGEHVKWTDWCHIVEGKQVKVTFEYPCALQIDGEVIPNVLTYTVQA